MHRIEQWLHVAVARRKRQLFRHVASLSPENGLVFLRAHEVQRSVGSAPEPVPDRDVGLLWYRGERVRLKIAGRRDHATQAVSEDEVSDAVAITALIYATAQRQHRCNRVADRRTREIGRRQARGTHARDEYTRRSLTIGPHDKAAIQSVTAVRRHAFETVDARADL